MSPALEKNNITCQKLVVYTYHLLTLLQMNLSFDLLQVKKLLPRIWPYQVNLYPHLKIRKNVSCHRTWPQVSKAQRQTLFFKKDIFHVGYCITPLSLLSAGSVPLILSRHHHQMHFCGYDLDCDIDLFINLPVLSVASKIKLNLLRLTLKAFHNLAHIGSAIIFAMLKRVHCYFNF